MQVVGLSHGAASLRWAWGKQLLAALLLAGFAVASFARTNAATTHDPSLQRVVFGSFATAAAAQAWSTEVEGQLRVPTVVLESVSQGQARYRVVGAPMPAERSRATQQAAQGLQWSTWSYPVSALAVAANGNQVAAAVPINAAVTATPTHIPATADQELARVEDELDLNLALQSRSFAKRGNAGQDRWQVSASMLVQWQRSWDEGQRAFTATPFLRVDSQDSERTHFDFRELFVSAIGGDWELHIGARHVFWGVTEFHHLVDVINQTDLVENIDTEDKLGQPMVQLSLVRDWGILDFMLLPGFRERTFPGDDGRLRALLPINTDSASYASGAGDKRIDGALRWSHTLGGVDFGLYHFSGTNRDPQLPVVALPAGGFELRPHYTTIDQTGLDAQVNWGDWAFKLEAISRSGDGERYAAANVGLERTLVGAFGTRADLGLVLEYMFDERGEKAANSFFEQDLAVGLRWQVNDMYDSQALLGVIWDTRSDEVLVSLEAQRRLGEHWQLTLEGRAFAGAHSPGQQPLLSLLSDLSQKTATLQQDDYLQLELTRYF